MRRMRRDVEMAENMGLLQVKVDDVTSDGYVEVDGEKLLNLGSCSYLALNLRPELIEAAILGIRRFGVSYSSSRTYSALGLYRELEQKLAEATGAPVIVTGSTTLAHLAVLPTLVEHDDLVVIDAQAHASLHLACAVLASRGVEIHTIAHNDLDGLAGLCNSAPGVVWYLTDTVFSMFGDIAPIDDLRSMTESIPNLRLYLDDAHGFAWAGRHGRGLALGDAEIHPQMIIAASLSKTFGAGGGLIICPDDETRLRILRTGGTLTFTGPVQVAELAAGVAAADILLSENQPRLRANLETLFDTVISGADRLGIRLASTARTPIWFAEIGPVEKAFEMAATLRELGYMTNVSGFPAVPHGRAGIRFTTTLHHTPDQIAGFLETLAGLISPAITIDLTVDEDALIDR